METTTASPEIPTLTRRQIAADAVRDAANDMASVGCYHMREVNFLRARADKILDGQVTV